MDALKKKKNTLLAISVIATILFIVGIPGIVLSATNGLTFLMIICIVFVGGGFYGMPVLWIAYSSKVSLERTMIAIEYDHMYTVEEIAMQRRISQRDALEQVNKLIAGRFLTGYIFDGNELKLNQNQKLSEIKSGVKCPSCGANVEISGKQGRCPYCGCLVDNPDK